MYRKKIILTAAIIVATLHFTNIGGFCEYRTGYTAATIDAAMRITTLIAVDNYHPLTHYNAGDFNISFTPMYFNIPLVEDVDTSGGSYASNMQEDSHVFEGEDLTGWAIGLTGNYAINHFISIYTSLIRLYTKGKVVQKINDEATSVTDGTNKIYVARVGLGFDLVRFFNSSSKWSTPLIGGVYYQRFKTKMYYTHFTTSNQIDFAMKLDAENSVNTYFVGFTVSRKFKLWGQTFEISPFLIYDYGLEHAIDIEMKVVLGNSTLNEGDTLHMSGGRDAGFYPGLNISYEGSESLSFSLSLGGLLGNRINYYNDIFFESLEINTYSFTITYNYN